MNAMVTLHRPESLVGTTLDGKYAKYEPTLLHNGEMGSVVERMIVAPGPHLLQALCFKTDKDFQKSVIAQLRIDFSGQKNYVFWYKIQDIFRLSGGVNPPQSYGDHL